MATKKKAAPKKAAKQAPRRGLDQPKGIVSATKKHARSKAAIKGHETRKMNQMRVTSALTAGRIFYFEAKTQDPQPKPVGTITGLAERNENLSLDLGARIGSVLYTLRYKLTGLVAETPISKEKEFSPSTVVSAQQRTQDNLEAALKLIEELDQLQEVNL